jgi:hypothetical protein
MGIHYLGLLPNLLTKGLFGSWQLRSRTKGCEQAGDPEMTWVWFIPNPMALEPGKLIRWLSVWESREGAAGVQKPESLKCWRSGPEVEWGGVAGDQFIFICSVWVHIRLDCACPHWGRVFPTQSTWIDILTYAGNTVTDTPNRMLFQLFFNPLSWYLTITLTPETREAAVITILIMQGRKLRHKR